jgi:hypothetical protein
MTAELEKLTPSELTHRAFAGVSQGAAGAASTALGQLGLLAFAPVLRQLAKAPKRGQAGFETQTMPQAASLLERMVHTSGRDPEKGTKLRAQFSSKPYEALYGKGRLRSSGQPIDLLRISKGLSPEVMAHEVGHAATTTRLSKALQTLSTIARSKPGLAAPTLMALTGAVGPSDEKDVHAFAKAAPLLGTAQMAAILGEETRANIRGSKILKNLGYKSSLGKRLKMFAPAASYLTHLGLLVGAPIGVLKGIKAYNKAQQEGKPLPPKAMLFNQPTELAKIPTLEEAQQTWATRLGK